MERWAKRGVGSTSFGYGMGKSQGESTEYIVYGSEIMLYDKRL